VRDKTAPKDPYRAPRRHTSRNSTGSASCARSSDADARPIVLRGAGAGVIRRTRAGCEVPANDPASVGSTPSCTTAAMASSTSSPLLSGKSGGNSHRPAAHTALVEKASPAMTERKMSIRETIVPKSFAANRASASSDALIDTRGEHRRIVLGACLGRLPSHVWHLERKRM
jgi:hypothetical protein